MKNLTRGQVTIPILLTVGGLVAASVAGIFKIELSAKTDIAQVSERVVRLETSVPSMQQDIQEIKESLKSIEKALRIK